MAGKENKQEEDREIPEKDAEEIELEKIVFGDFEGFESGLRELDLENYSDIEVEEDEEEDDEDINMERDEGELIKLQDDELFFVDEGKSQSDDESMSRSESNSESGSSVSSASSAAWQDSDDEKLQISLTAADRLRKLRTTRTEELVNGKEYTRRLRARFEKMNPTPEWAKPKHDERDDDSNNSDGGEEDVEDDELTVTQDLAKLLQSKSSYITKSFKSQLSPEVIDIQRLKDANSSLTSKSAIQTLDFHPTHSLLLSSGYDRTLRMYHVDGKTNPIATTLHVKGSPFQTAKFHNDGKRVFAAGRRRYLYVWDIESGQVTKLSRMYGHEQTQRSMENFELSPCGNYISMVGSNGWMNLLSAASGQWITGAKIEGKIADICWHSDEKTLSIVNTYGQMWEWDAVARKFSDQWHDEGGVGTTRLALGGKSDRWCAIGSKSGIVNIYDRTIPESRKPVAVLDQLVTTINSLKFSNDGQVLAIGSRAKRDAFKLCHVPSFTVFKNWPTSGTPLGRVTAVAFTPGTEMLCTGNEGGYARLWKLNHYT